MTINELKDLLKDRGLDMSLFLPEEFTTDAIVGISSLGNVIYDRYKLAHLYAVDYAKQDGVDYDDLEDEKQGEYEQSGMEWIDYNITGAIYSTRKNSDGTIPIIIMDSVDDFF